MATLIHRENTDEREFHVPFSGPLGGSPFYSEGELVIQTWGDRPTWVALRFFPTQFEFYARLPKLVAGTPLEDSVMDLGAASTRSQPVVVFEADEQVLERIPKGLEDLDRLEAFLNEEPPIFEMKEYHLAAVEFEARR